MLWHGEDGEVSIKLIDFGMATYQPEGELLTMSCGSPHYAAPEIMEVSILLEPQSTSAPTPEKHFRSSPIAMMSPFWTGIRLRRHQVRHVVLRSCPLRHDCSHTSL